MLSTDIDNLEKFVLDALNGHAYEDDGQVVRTESSKLYGKEARTIVEIYSLIV